MPHPDRPRRACAPRCGDYVRSARNRCWFLDASTVALARGVSVDWHDAFDLIERLLGDPQPPGADPGLVADLLPLLRAGALLDGWAEQWHAHERSRYHARRNAALNVLTRPSERGWHEYGSHTGRPTHRENR